MDELVAAAAATVAVSCYWWPRARCILDAVSGRATAIHSTQQSLQARHGRFCSFSNARFDLLIPLLPRYTRTAGQAKSVLLQSPPPVFRFARAAGTGNVPVSLSASSRIIYAFSQDNSKAFRDHGPNL